MNGKIHNFSSKKTRLNAPISNLCYTGAFFEFSIDLKYTEEKKSTEELLCKIS